MNQMTFIGRIVRPIELKEFPNGQRVVNNALAVSRNHKNKDGQIEADFISIVAWNFNADLLKKYCQKGQQIGIVGQLRSRHYQGADGERKYITECLVEEITLLANGVPNNASNNVNRQADSDGEAFQRYQDAELQQSIDHKIENESIPS